MKHPGKLMTVVAMTALLFSACQKDIKTTSTASDEVAGTEETDDQARYHHGGYGQGGGYVYTMNNKTEGNKVMVYRRNHNGELSFHAAYSTGGQGTGSGLGNQGGLILSDDGKTLLVVNAGSNSISSFKISGGYLRLISTVSSGGMMPISITQHGSLVYALNAGGDGNISGFRLSNWGKLYAIPYSKRPLSSNASGPAQISFVNNGKVLAITEKATNKIITYTVGHYGTPGAFHSINSANATPFGFDTGEFGRIVVSEAAGGAAGASTVSAYKISYNGAIELLDGPVASGQTAACWVVLTDNQRYAYTTNTGSANVSSFKLHYGDLDLLDATAASSGMGPIDAALSDHSRFLYVLNGGSHSISAYEVKYNGELSDVQTVTGLPESANGLAAD